jgi:1-acyl-sn-glycerol-3-phosphate acyltransferase
MRGSRVGLYAVGSRVVRAFLLRTRIYGLRNVPERGPAILVGNHEGAYGPVALLTGIAPPLRPWVVRHITERSSAAEYIRADFVEKELRLKGPVAAALSAAIGRICVALMKGIGAIPVYRNSRFLGRTIGLSLEALERGEVVAIFPEIQGSEEGRPFGRFDTGFARLAKLFFERTGRSVDIIPVAVNKARRSIGVGPPLRLNPEAPYLEERERLRIRVEDRILALYRGFEDAG